MSMEGFKKFILRGNVVDLAVGITVGAAFSGIATALVKDFITPLVGAIIKTPDFSGWVFYINGSKFAVGDLINAFVSFFLIAVAVYFCIVLPMNKLIERMKGHEIPADPTNKKCTECLSEIPIKATRCAFCTQPQVVQERVETISQ
jgi:large conductance mechanosensitive channel